MTKHKSAAWRDSLPLEIKSEKEGEADPIKAIETLGATIEAKFGKIEGELKTATDRLDAEVAKLKRPGADTKSGEPPLEAKAFGGFIRKGREALEVEEVKALRTSDDTSGGYLAPAEFVAEVIKGIVEVSPIRQAARVGSTSSGSVMIPKRTARPTANWEGELEDADETGSTYGQVEIPIHEARCYVDVSQKLLEDAAVNVEAEVAADLAEEFGRLEGNAFLTGNGVKKPLGIMSTSGINYTATGNASTLGSEPADALITLMYALPAFYRNNGVWMMNGNTLASIRKLKDGQGNFLWQPSYQAGQPETILGRPVIEAVDMADVGSAAEPIIFGDFGRAFRIYDRLSLSLMRDPYSVAKQGLVRFHARRRTGAAVVLTEALRKLKCATS